MRAALVAIGLGLTGLALPAPAAADHADATVVYGTFGGGLGGLTGPLARDWSVDTGRAELGVGFRHRRVEVTLGLGYHFLDSDQPMRDTSDLWGLSYGGDAGYHVAIGGNTSVFARVGWRWRRIWSGEAGTVRRDCDATGTCAGGYYVEDVAYWVDGPTGVVGVESDWIKDGFMLGMRLQLEALGMFAELPGDRVAGLYLGTRLDLIFGGVIKRAPRRRT